MTAAWKNFEWVSPSRRKAAEPEPSRSGEVECDEVYVVAGHKGNPGAVEKKAEWADGDA